MITRLGNSKRKEVADLTDLKKSGQEVSESKIDKLEEGFCEKQKNYMDYAFKARDIRKCNIIFPYLKSTHKVQKMTEQEIREKNITNLKFRPIIDARRWATRGYAGLIMGMLRKANEELISRAGPVLK